METALSPLRQVLSNLHSHYYKDVFIGTRNSRDTASFVTVVVPMAENGFAKAEAIRYDAAYSPKSYCEVVIHDIYSNTQANLTLVVLSVADKPNKA